MQLGVLGKNNEGELFNVDTNHAAKDKKAIEELIKYLEDKTEKKENVKGNVNENNGIGMDINAGE